MRNPSEHFSHDDSGDSPPLTACVNAHVLMHVCIHIFPCECGGQRLASNIPQLVSILFFDMDLSLNLELPIG